MTDLLNSLDQTITQLEKIRDNTAELDSRLIGQLSDLFDQQERLLEMEVASQTAGYQFAAEAMAKAAHKAKSEAEDLSDATDLVKKIATALGAIEDLIG